MTKQQELAKQILRTTLLKRNSEEKANQILEYLNNEVTVKTAIAAIVEALNTPAKEDVVNIERKDLEKNIRAFINRTCFSTTIQGRYGNWMSLRECLTSFGFELLSSIEKKLAAPAKEGITHVMIECPECETIQAAIIEHTVPFGTYIHHCENCKYIIMESEWNQVKPFKAPAKEVEAISDSELEQLANDAIPTHPYPDMEYPATAVTKFKRESWMDGYKAAKEAISVPVQQGVKWMEISTKPHTDEGVLLSHDKDGWIVCGEEIRGKFYNQFDVSGCEIYPTHWMPLPEPPAAQPLQPSLEENKEEDQP